MKNINNWNKTYIITACYVFMFGLLLCGIALTLFAPLLFDLIIGEAFSDGVQYVFWVAMAYVFLGFYKMFSGFLFYTKKNLILSYIAIFNVITNLLLNYFLILRYGAMGAAYATAISYFLFFIITAIISYRIYPMAWFNFGAVFHFIKQKYFQQ